MKTQRFFQSLTRQLIYWRQKRYKRLRRNKHLLGTVRSLRKSLRQASQTKTKLTEVRFTVLSHVLQYLSKTSDKWEKQKRTTTSSMAAPQSKSPIFAVGFGSVGKKRSPVILAIAVVSLTGVMGHKLYNQPQLKVGTVAPQTFKAPYPDSIEDPKKTELERKAASYSSVPILMVDGQINEQIDQDIQQILNAGNEIRTVAGSFPFFDTLVLPLATQRFLRSCPDSQWQALVVGLQNTSKSKVAVKTGKQKSQIATLKALDSYGQGDTVPIQSQEEINFGLASEKIEYRRKQLSLESKPDDISQKADFSQAIAELEAYRLITSTQNLSSLISQISQARQKYIQAKAKFAQLASPKPEIYDKKVLLELSDDDWTKTQMGIQQTAQRILTQGISPGLPPTILESAVRLQVQALVPENAEPLATKLLLAVIKPNLKKDEEQTKQQAAQAAAGVKPIIMPIRQGAVIVRKGEKITAWNFEVLEHYHLVRREINWWGLSVLGSAVSGCVGIFALVERRTKCHNRQRDRLLILLLTLSTPVVLTMGTPYTTWSAIGLLLGSFYGPTLAVTVVGLLALVLPISLEISKIALLSGAAGGIIGCCIAQRLRSREELALLGVAIALTEGGVYLLLKVLIGAAFGSGSFLVLQEAAFFAFSGLAWSIVALGLSPYLEKLFDLVTPIRLAELANPNRPLLKKLATEIPGTFQHTLFVATLAEAAAKHLGCNVELVRAGTLYHDIGKMHDPLGFIENQMGGPNKHDTEIKDPWKSAEIIKKHVSEGLVMARKHSLPKAIQAFIPEHQGTMHIAYFYHQAQQMAQLDPSIKIDEADFRYDGPIPQSRETAIVMLADSCEAALRSLKDATPEQALVMLNNILRAKWQDNQLLDSGLTRKEMSEIGEIFVRVWQQFHHKRIAYPKLKASHEKGEKI